MSLLLICFYHRVSPWLAVSSCLDWEEPRAERDRGISRHVCLVMLPRRVRLQALEEGMTGSGGGT